MADSTALLKRRGGQTSPRVRIPPSPIAHRRLPQLLVLQATAAGVFYCHRDCDNICDNVARHCSDGPRSDFSFPGVSGVEGSCSDVPSISKNLSIA